MKNPQGGMTNFYFGSLKAVYDIMPRENVGITYKALTNAIHGKGFYENKKVVVRIGRLIRASRRHASPCDDVQDSCK